MKIYSLISTPSNPQAFIFQKSTFPISQSSLSTTHKQQKRNQSQLNSQSYNRSLRRSLSRAKMLAFFNPDMIYFSTFTYKLNNHTPEQVVQDIKQFIKYQKKSLPRDSLYSLNNNLLDNNRDVLHISTRNNKKHIITPAVDFPHKRLKKTSSSPCGNVQNFEPRLKFIYVLERQKRGSIHVHMIHNNFFQTFTNKNGYQSLKYWNHGFTSTLTIENFDKNFKPYLYLFKYMHKTERVARSFIHTSRSFDKIAKVDFDKYIHYLKALEIYYEEDAKFSVNDVDYTIQKTYYK